jgi:hypothetical protein
LRRQRFVVLRREQATHENEKARSSPGVTPVVRLLRPERLNYRLRRRKNTQRGQRSALEYDVAVDLHLELRTDRWAGPARKGTFPTSLSVNADRRAGVSNSP